MPRPLRMEFKVLEFPQKSVPQHFLTLVLLS